MKVDCRSRQCQRGFTVIEMTITLIVMALLLGAMSVTAGTVFEAREQARKTEAVTRSASLAMRRMIEAARQAPGLMLPMPDKPLTAKNEALREQRVPPTPGFEDDTAVLALLQAVHIDRNQDGIVDADNDGDGRIDEDPGGDITNDSAPGIRGIDDDNDGVVDELSGLEPLKDDDEDGGIDEDGLVQGDADGDGWRDEDPADDLNGDHAPGIVGVDDDGDGQIDEGTLVGDDDEDGFAGEDWLDPVVFYISNGKLIERQPYPFDSSGDGKIGGDDYVEAVLAEDVSFFSVRRIEASRGILVELTLELTTAGLDPVSLSSQVRVGGGV